MSFLNANINNLPSDLQLSVFQFAVEDHDNTRTPSQTVQNICRVCRQWTDLTYSNLLPQYWNRVNSLIKAVIPNQNFIELLTKVCGDHVGLIPFERLSKALRSSSLMLLPSEYQCFIDAQLEKMWGRVKNSIDFAQDSGPQSASEIRAWLKDPNNIPLIQTVTILNLSGLQLTHLPPEIAYFTNLEELRLSHNQLRGFPAEIGNLAKLQRLDLDRNQFTTLPSEICNLPNLQRLYLNNNRLAALPVEIGNLANLEELYLEHNQLTALPSEIGILANLRRLDLDDNHLKALPAEIGNLANLRQLGLNKNQLATLPAEIGNLANLEELYLNNNQLKALPAEIGNLANLVWLYLNNNQLATIPSEIGNLANLEELYLNNNQLKALPAEIGNLDNLQRLYLNNNQLKALPSEIGTLADLEELYINYNQLAALPAEIGNLVNLQKLYLNNNQLAALPAEIGNLDNLVELYLEHNQLATLPSEIGTLANFLKIGINYNLCLFMLDKKLSKFVNVSVSEMFKKYYICKHYNTKTSFAKFCQLIHNEEDKNRLKEIFSDLSSTEQEKIRSKIEDIFVELPANQNIENKELLKSQALMEAFDVRRDILSRAILDFLNETFISFTPEQKYIVYQHVWSLAGKPQGNVDWGEKNAEDNIIRLIDATVLASNAEE